MKAMADEALFALRPATEKDWPFILQSWTRTYTNDRKWGPLAPRAVARAVHASILDTLTAEGTEVRIATNPSNPWFIFGYVVFSTRHEHPLVHWVYVKELYRKVGIGAELVRYARCEKPGPFHYTYGTKATKYVLPEGIWSPQLARPRKATDD
jgi:GNAT superfamily N-acetyltransferase